MKRLLLYRIRRQSFGTHWLIKLLSTNLQHQENGKFRCIFQVDEYYLTIDSDRVLVHSVDNPVGCIAAQLVKAWGGHVTATVSSRAMATAQQLSVDDLILHDGQEIDFDSLLSSRQKFDLVLNTVGSFMHDSCRALCVDGGLVVTTVASPPASDKYGLIYGSLYSMWLRLKLIFLKVGIFFQVYPLIGKSVMSCF